MDLEKSDKLGDINTILDEKFNAYYDNAFAPGHIKEQIRSNSVFGLSNFISDVDSGLIGWLRGWTTSIIFSSTVYNSISWTSGTINLSNGNTYTIGSGTLTLTTTHYIYLDTAVSTTTLQTTTVSEDSVWGTKLLVAFIKIGTVGLKAIIKTFGGQGDSFIVDELNIGAGAVTASKTSIASINATNGEINANKVGTLQLDTNAVTWAKILDGAITSVKTSIASIDSTSWNLTANSVSATQITAGAVTAVKIQAGAVTANKITSYNFMVSEGVFTDNSPTAGKVSWVWVKIMYNGTEYTITNGDSSTDKYVYWQIATPTVLWHSATLPALGNDDFLVLTQTAGVHTLVWNSTVINGNRITAGSVTASNIATGTITANEIASNTITASQIASNTITSAQIFAGTITATQIATGTITANEIATNTITANKMNINTLSAITADLGTITAGTITVGSGGFIRSWQSAYDTGTGFYLGNDAGTPKFSIGNSAGNKVTWDGSALAVNGSITAGAGSVLSTAYLSGSIPQANLNLADRGWTQTCAFSVADADTVAWGSGILTSADGTDYSITAGNTGNMTAKTFVYLDIAVSTTAYQTTTTPATAVWVGKVMVAIAQNESVEATYQVMGGQGGQNIDASSIVAGSITANEISTGAVTAGKISVTSLSAINANMGSITAGSIIVTTGSNTVKLEPSATDVIISGPTWSPTFKVTQAGAMTSTSGTIWGTTITSSALTGWTIQTATSGARIVMDGTALSSYDSVGNIVKLDSATNSIAFQNGASAAYFRFRLNSFVATLETDAVLRTYSAFYSTGIWTGQIDASGTINANYKFKLPVGSNLY